MHSKAYVTRLDRLAHGTSFVLIPDEVSTRGTRQ